jgi:hypothetical protein
VSGFGALDAVCGNKFLGQDFAISNKRNLQALSELGDFHSPFGKDFLSIRKLF